MSDHHFIYAVRKIGVPRGQPRFIESRNFKHFDDTEFKLDLESAPWPSIEDFQDVNEVWIAWKEVFLSVVDKHVPLRTKKAIF